MNQIFDRLGNLIRSTFSDDSDDYDFTVKGPNIDPDMKAAWAELNDFLNEDDFSEAKYENNSPGNSDIPIELKPDYSTLNVEFGVEFSEVKKAYKKLAIQNHPDRFANDPSKLKKATETMKKLNSAFHNIRKFEEERAKKT